MGKTVKSYIDLDGSVSTVSIALNGLLKINGPLTKVRECYQIDVTEDFVKSKNDEIRIMYNKFFQHIEHLNIWLVELTPYQTRMTYVIEKKTNNALIIFLLILDTLFSFLCGYGFSVFIDSYTARILIFCFLFITIFVLFGTLPLSYAVARTDNSINKQMETCFLERLVKYISIVQKNQ